MDTVDNYITGDLPLTMCNIYNIEWIRLDSFKYWKGKPNNSFEEAAEAGIFHRENTIDTVGCIHCRQCFHQWEENENIKAGYLEGVPECTGSAFNIPKRYKYLTQFIIDSWFDMYRIRFSFVRKSPRLQATIDAFYEAYRIRKYDKSYLDGIDNDLVGFYSKDTKTMDDLTAAEIKDLKDIKYNIEHRLVFNTPSIIKEKE